MAQIPGLQTSGGLLPAPPIIARPGLLPGRIVPLLFPRLGSHAAKVTMKTQEYPMTPPLANVPASDLIAKLVSGFTDEYGCYHEVYLYMRNNVDPEAILDIRTGGYVAEGEVVGEVSRMCAAQLDVFLDGTLVKSFPKDVEAGYFGFKISSPS